MPTLGRPSSATRRGPAVASADSAGASGSAASTASSTSPLPRPWIALTGSGSPRPSDHSSPGLRLLPFVVNLVRRQDDGLAGPLQDPGDRAVVLGGAHDGVDDEQHRVGGLDGERGLLGDLRRKAARLRSPAPGIHDREPPAAPLGVVGHPVPGHPRDVLDDGDPAPQHPVDQRRLAHVGAPDDGEHGLPSGLPRR